MLFGVEGLGVAETELERVSPRGLQTKLVDETAPVASAKPRPRGKSRHVGQSEWATEPAREWTVLDRVHAAMLLQGSGKSRALREFLELEVHRSTQFLRLANALSALYPMESEEKRLLDAVLLVVPRR